MSFVRRRRSLLDFAAEHFGFNPSERLLMDKPLVEVLRVVQDDQKETVRPPAAKETP